MRRPSATTSYRVCNLCEAMCGIAVTVQDGQVVEIRGDEDDPFSRGHICPKATALKDLAEDPDRLHGPLRRQGDQWRTVGWEQAFDEVADRLAEVQQRHGHDAVAVYQGNPTVHNSGTMLVAPELFRVLGTHNRYSATSVDQLPHHLAAYLMFGHQLLLPVPDLDRTQYLLILGANPLVSNGSLMTAPDVRARLRGIQQRGGKIVVIDPRRTETAIFACEHHFIRPGTDVLLLAAMLRTILGAGLARPGKLGAYSKGRAELTVRLRPFSPERVAPVTGIPAGVIEQLARQIVAAPAAVCYGRVGVSTQRYGSACQWLINVLNILTGNLDRPGGAMFTTPAIDLVKQRPPGHYDRYRSRVRGAPEFGGELPVATLAEDILTPGPGQIRALITSAGNPVLSTPDGTRLDAALEQLEFMVSIDPYLNETTRHAHFILPPTCGLETDHYDLAFHLLAVRNTARYSQAVLAPVPDARHDWQIFRALAGRLGARTGRRPAFAARLLARLRPEQMLDLALRLGPYGAWGGRLLRPGGLSMRALKREPHGIDLGPLEPRLPERLATSDRRIHLAPELLLQELGRVEQALLEPGEPHRSDDTEAPTAHPGPTSQESTPVAANRAIYPPGELLLIGRRLLRSNNSWMHNTPRLMKGKPTCTLLMHPDDAAARGVRDGQLVQIRSRTGSVRVPVRVSSEMMPGVVSLPHGFGHDRPGVRLQVATQHRGASINDLTDELAVDAPSGNAAFSGVPVSIAACDLC